MDSELPQHSVLTPTSCESRSEKVHDWAVDALRPAACKTPNSTHRPRRQKTGRKFREPAWKARPGITVDTSFSRHRGASPQQVYPWGQEERGRLANKVGHKEQPGCFVRWGDIKTLSRETVQNSTGSSQPQDERRVVLQEQKASEGSSDPVNNRHDYSFQTTMPRYPRQCSDAEDAPVSLGVISQGVVKDGMRQVSPPLHFRVQGLRPSPLDLSDVSPSDQAITIGIAIPPASLPEHATSPKSAAPGEGNPDAVNRQRSASNAVTPTIMITPAREEYDRDRSGWYTSAESTPNAKAGRATSSIYSRATNWNAASRAWNTPPVPPLHLDKKGKPIIKPNSDATVPNQIFEEDEIALSSRGGRIKSLHRLTTDTVLPTPLRSRGWWNVLTSPFLARPDSKIWPSSVVDDAMSPEAPMLAHAAGFGTVENDWLSRHSEHVEDDDEGNVCVRSASPSWSAVETVATRVVPKRSITAPGALDLSDSGLNIYRVPSTDETAPYYDPTNHYGSPSAHGPAYTTDFPYGNRGLSCQSQQNESRSSDRDEPIALDRSPKCLSVQPRDPLADVAQPELEDSVRSAQEEIVFDKTAHTPTLDRLCQPHTPVLASGTKTITPLDACSSPGARTDDGLSPTSATPVVEVASVATFLSARIPCQTQREVEILPPRTPSPQAGHGRTPAIEHPVSDERSAKPSVCTTNGGKIVHQPVALVNDIGSGLGISRFGTMKQTQKQCSEKAASLITTSEHRRYYGHTSRRPLVLSREQSSRPPERKRLLLWLALTGAFSVLVLTVILLAMFVPQKQKDMQVRAQWLNLTGFPPIPTGISTIAQPDPIEENSQCAKPSDTWSCALPREQQDTGRPRELDQPDFRFEIRFRNGSIANSSLLGIANSSVSSRAVNAVSAHALVRRSVVAARDAWMGSLFAPSPAPPSVADRTFLGNTTDNVTVPYDGEETPFSITFLNASFLAAHSRLVKRQDASAYPLSTTDKIVESNPSAENVSFPIPSPSIDSEGKPNPAILYPFPRAQPLRLFDRGLNTEHYGFYTYFDRTIFLSSVNASDTGVSNTSAINDGTARENADALCTWAQTRFKVQFWTRKSSVNLLRPLTSANKTTNGDATSAPVPAGSLNGTDVPAVNSSANDLTRPGSFPYPVTVTLDRHGGDPSKKSVYCYGVKDGKVINGVKTLIFEDRAAGGTLVNAAAAPGPNTAVGARSAGRIGVDGGTGGCRCAWANWQ
ncbi:hypothetical protein LTR66_005955 [Elasticomyces elasticus]|nr:hypothetical protein LTR66_005955 [Elasticomyces elasticus]